MTPHPTRLIAASNVLLTQAFGVPIIVGPNLNAWSAKNWCEAQGKQLLDVSDMGCYLNGVTLATGGATTTYCCKKDQMCQQSRWDTNLWNGTTIQNGSGPEVAKFSNTMVALRKIFTNRTFVLIAPYGNTSPNTCYTFVINSTTGFVGLSFPYGKSYTLCK